VTAETVAATIAQEAAQYRLLSAVVAIASGLALFLASAGLYGATAFAVTRRAKEIGIRMALGARRRDVVELFVSSLKRPLLIGVGLGLPLAMLVARLLDTANVFLVLEPNELAPYGWAVLMLLVTAGLATVIPVMTTSRPDPVNALRCD
jgi:ABC-type antimicrobial peptide transport system permease subunit